MPRGNPNTRRAPYSLNEVIDQLLPAAATAGEFVPGAGVADAFGYFPDGEGGYRNSLFDNLSDGEYADAAFQGAGVGADALSLLPVVGIGLSTGAKGAINFTKKALREKDIAKKVAKAAKAEKVKKGKSGKREKVDPDKFRQMQEAQGEAAVLAAVARGDHLKPDGYGGYIGAPRHVASGQALGAMRRSLDGQFNDSIEAIRAADPDRLGTWYDRAKDGIAMSTEPYQTSRVLDQHGVYSAGVSPESELAFSLKHLNSRALGDPKMAYRGAGMRTLDKSVEADKPAKLAFKVGEYRKKNDPALPNDGLFGVNDFRMAQTFGYTTPDGQIWTGGVGSTMHPFMDGETALMVKRANDRAAGGRSDWAGPHIQELPWVLGKAQDIYDRGKKARFAGPDGVNMSIREANNTAQDYMYKHAGSGTYEYTPGASTGHMVDMLNAPYDAKVAYGDEGRWDRVLNSRGDRIDAIYSALGMRQVPTIDSAGLYRNSQGVFETNPLRIARPLVDFPTGGGGGRMDPLTSDAMAAAERLRGVVDAQEASAFNLPNTMNSVTGKNSLLFDTRPPGETLTGVQPTSKQLEAVTNLLDDGYGVTATSRGALVFPFDPDMPAAATTKMLRKKGAAMEAAMGVPATKALATTGYVPGVGKWGADDVVPTAPYSGEATAGLLEELANLRPEAVLNLSESEGIRRAIDEKILRDERMGGARGDIQNTRKFLANADWAKAVELVRGGMKPAAAVAALGYSLNTMAAEERDYLDSLASE